MHEPWKKCEILNDTRHKASQISLSYKTCTLDVLKTIIEHLDCTLGWSFWWLFGGTSWYLVFFILYLIWDDAYPCLYILH